MNRSDLAERLLLAAAGPEGGHGRDGVDGHGHLNELESVYTDMRY